MSKVETSVLDRLAAFGFSSDNPFCDFVRSRIAEMEGALKVFGIGAVVSGGQTGVDSAAFDVADTVGLPRTGFAPRSLSSEQGAIPQHYVTTMIVLGRACGSVEGDQTDRGVAGAPADPFAERTELNARYSEATLILNPGSELQGGTLLTKTSAERYHDPSRVYIVDLNRDLGTNVRQAEDWIKSVTPLLLNIAGPRESSSAAWGKSIYDSSFNTLSELFQRLRTI